MEEKKTGLELLREPFPNHQISQLPKPTKAQTEAVRKDFKSGIRCKICGGWHHPKVIHLDYVGHAALTDRLLDCDPEWNWKPLTTTEAGLPAFDDIGGLWISLTVNGVTRMGYGSADNKKGGDAVKEIIGDALRNAAMRFGAALDLWHKGSLHGMDDTENARPDTGKPKATPKTPAKTTEPKPDKNTPNLPGLKKKIKEIEKTLGETGSDLVAAYMTDNGIKYEDLQTKDQQLGFYHNISGYFKAKKAA